MIIAVLVCLAAFALAFIFEVIYAMLYEWVEIGMDMWLWTAVYWVAIGLVGCFSGIIPTRPPIPGCWVAFALIAFGHINMNIHNPNILTFRRRFRNAERDERTKPDDNVTGRTDTSQQEDLYYEDNDRND